MLLKFVDNLVAKLLVELHAVSLLLVEIHSVSLFLVGGNLTGKLDWLEEVKVNRSKVHCKHLNSLQNPTETLLNLVLASQFNWE